MEKENKSTKTLDILKEFSLFYEWLEKWVEEQFPPERGIPKDFTVETALSLFAKGRPWGNRKNSLKIEKKIYNTLRKLGNPKSLMTVEERLKLYETLDNKNKKRKDLGRRIEVSEEQFWEAVKADIKWDKLYGEKFENAYKTQYPERETKKLRKESEPLLKKRLRLSGLRVCKRKGCVNIIPPENNPRQEYCSDKCGIAHRTKKHYGKYPKNRAIANRKYHLRATLDEIQRSKQKQNSNTKTDNKSSQGIKEEYFDDRTLKGLE